MADKRNGKISKKKVTDDSPYVQPIQTEDEMDFIINEMQADLDQTPATTTKRKRSQSTAKNGSLNIKDYEINEAEEAASKPTKNAKTQTKEVTQPQQSQAQQSQQQQSQPQQQTTTKTVKLPKVWTPSESSVLFLLLTGTPPLGRNPSGILFIFLSFYLLFNIFLSFLSFFSIFPCFDML